MDDPTQDHFDIATVARQGQCKTFNNEVVARRSREHYPTFPVGELTMFGDPNVLIADRAGEVGMNVVEVPARQVAPHHPHVLRANETVLESQRIALDVDHEKVGK